MEFETDQPDRMRTIFQPHVPGEPSVGAHFGEARYVHDGMDIIFLAASENRGKFDYSLYEIGAVTGSEQKQLLKRTGMYDELSLSSSGNAILTSNATVQKAVP